MRCANSIVVSIIVPVYNEIEYIKQCVGSITRQTFNNLQIILVDDGSTDGSEDICDQYAENDARIIVIHKANGGLVDARKAGLKEANGDYVTFVDGDDWIENNMIQEMVENIVATDADFVHTGTILETQSGTQIDCRYDAKVVDCPKNNKEIWAGIFGEHKNYYLNRGVTRKLFKRELIHKCYEFVPNDRQYGEDHIAVTRCYILANRVSFIKKAYYHYLIHEGSFVTTVGLKKMFWLLALYEHLMSVYAEYGMEKFIEPYLTIGLAKELWPFCLAKSQAHIMKYSVIPLVDVLVGKRIILYGAGKVGYDYFLQIPYCRNCSVIAWVDKNYKRIHYPEGNVSAIESIYALEYDLILIAISKPTEAEQVRMSLINQGVDSNVIYWQKPIVISTVR